MSDLGPIKPTQPGVIPGDNGAQNGVTPAGGNNSNSSQTLSSLENERSRIRTELPEEEDALKDSQVQVNQSGITADSELDAVQESRASESASNNEFEDATLNAQTLNSQADLKEFEAEHGDNTPEAKIRLEFEADELRDEAQQEELTAKKAEAKAEESGQQAVTHSANGQVAEQNQGNASAQVASQTNKVSSLRAQGSTLSGTSGSTASTSSGATLSGTSGSTGSTSSGTTLSGTSGQKLGQSSFTTFIQTNGPAGAYVDAAVAILGAIVKTALQSSGNASPVVQISKNLSIKGLSEQAIMYLETAAIFAATAGAPINSQIIFRKAQANSVHGEAETNIAFWKEAINDNKSLLKQTQDLAKMV